MKHDIYTTDLEILRVCYFSLFILPFVFADFERKHAKNSRLDRSTEIFDFSFLHAAGYVYHCDEARQHNSKTSAGQAFWPV